MYCGCVDRMILRDLEGGSRRLESQDKFNVVKDKTFGILVDASKYGDDSLLSQGGSGRQMYVSWWCSRSGEAVACI